MGHACTANSRFLSSKNTRTDFEFNKPILKKGPRILKDFEKNRTDFEGFAMDFEKISKPGAATHGKQAVKTEKFSRLRQKFQPQPAKRSGIMPWHELCYIRRALGSPAYGIIELAGLGATQLFH